MWICEKGGHCVEPCDGCEHHIEVVEVKRGEWYRHDKKKHGDTCFYCSVCEGMAFTDGFVWELTDFCPNCGADMRGKKDEVM